ncbi:MAG TPA: trimeric intracellular cation channel family protein [Flavobacteriaceae bacterium]|nr:trimeric intracellular cation channel family protein [Flavobacteriaceae bacterium]
MIEVIDILGTIAFTISGVLVALHKRMDLFGIIIIGFVTAVGGGTIRDLLIGFTPVTWMQQPRIVYIVLLTSIFALIFRKRLDYLRTSLFLFDTIGIGLYTVIGLQKGIQAELHPVICIALGTITACFGGVLRDILCNEIPVIFRKEIYATACILGGLTYFVLYKLNLDESLLFLVSGIVVILVRLLAVKFKISLPKLYQE